MKRGGSRKTIFYCIDLPEYYGCWTDIPCGEAYGEQPTVQHVLLFGGE